MAAALRKVTENYDWTLKRADNDLHNVITQTPSPPTPPSRPDIKPVDPSGASTWDANHLRWKFWTEYEELCEHLGRSLLILFSWIVSICRLLMAATTHFIEHCISSAVEESIKPADLDESLTFIWSLLVSLSRSAASLIVSLLWEVIRFSVPPDVKTYAKNGSRTRFASWLSGQPALALVPVKGLKGLSFLAKNMDTSTSDAPQSQLTALLADNLRAGFKAMYTVVNDEARRLST